MVVLSTIALVLLTLVGYSSGVTLAGRTQTVLPTIADLLLVMGLWIAVLPLRDTSLNHWLLVFVGLLLGIGLGYAATAVRLARADPQQLIPASELPAHAREPAPAHAAGNILQRAWRRWNEFAAPMGNVQSRLIMGFFYFIFITPVGAAFRLFADPLTVKRSYPGSGWLPKPDIDASLEAAKEQG